LHLNKNKKAVGCLDFVNDAHFDKKIKKQNDRFWLVNWLDLCVEKNYFYKYNFLKILMI